MASPSELYDKAKDINGEVTVEGAISVIKQHGSVPVKKAYDLTVSVKQLANAKGIISPASWNTGFPSLSRFLTGGPPSPSPIRSSGASPSPFPTSPPSSPFSKVPGSSSSRHPAKVSPTQLSASSETKIPRENRPKWVHYLAEAEKIVKKQEVENENSSVSSSSNMLSAAVVRQLLSGEVMIEAIPHVKKVVRVFVSSTFTDTEAERNLLMVDVFPYLTRLCQLFGVQFEIVDMRWGVREFTNDDHGTFNLCMSELHKCRAESMGPAFFCLLGDKYGFRPFPNKIVQHELDKMWETIKKEDIEKVQKAFLPSLSDRICGVLSSAPLATLWDAFDAESSAALAKDDLALIPRWYKLDTNAVPPTYVLQTITALIPEFRSTDGNTRNAASSRWWKIFEELTLLLRIGSVAISEEEREKYFMSVTEAEVHNGILLNKERGHQSFCNRRQISSAVMFPADIPSRPKFVDVMPNKNVDTEAHDMLELLKMKKVPHVLPASNIIDYTVSPALVAAHELSPTELHQRDQYLFNFSETTCELIVKAIFAGYAKNNVTISPLQSELIQQYNFCLKKRTNITTPLETLKCVMSYLTAPKEHPHVIWGESGSGKTSLVALIIQQIKEQYPDAHVVYRFSGISPASSSARQLLQSVYSQIVELLTSSENPDIDVSDELFKVASEFRVLVENFSKLLAHVSKSKQMFIILDSLDQLSNDDDGLSLRWLPWQVPPNVHLVVSTLPVLLEAVQSKHKGGEECYTQVPRMNPSDGLPMMQNWLKVEQRTLTPKQQEVAMEAFRKCPLPLYLRVATDVMIKWPSYLPSDSAHLEDDLPSLISNSILHQIELIHGEKLVSHALGYITAAKDGLSCSELEGILSCDEEVLRDVYQWWTPPTRVLPPMLWKRVREALGGYLLEHGATNAVVYKWYHRQFWEAAEIRYLSREEREVPLTPIGNGVDSLSHFEARHLALVKYFNGDWSSPKCVSYIDKSGKAASDDRLIRPQPLQFSATVFNTRKLMELPYHQTLANIPAAYDSTLYDFNFITAKFAAKLHFDLLQDYLFAIEHINSEKYPDHFARLTNYQRFVARNMHIFVQYPEMVLQQAINGPDSEQVTIDAKRYVLSTPNKPIMMQWVNKNQDADPCLKTITVLGDAVTSFDLTPDAKRVVVSTWDSVIKIFLISNGAEVAALQGHTNSVAKVRLFSDGKRLLSYQFTGLAHVWDVGSATILFSLQGDGSIAGADVSPDGLSIITAHDGGLQVWDAVTGATKAVLSNQGKKLEACVYSPLGDMFASANVDHVFVWRASDNTLLHQIPAHSGSGRTADGDNEVRRIIFSDEGRYILAPTVYDSFVMWEVSSQQQFNPIPPQTAWKSSGFRNIAQHREKVAVAIEDRIALFDISLKQIIGRFAHTNRVTHIRFTSDGKYLVSGCASSSIKIWDLSIKQKIEDSATPPAAETRFVGYLTFSPDGKVATVVSDEHIKVMPAEQLDKGTILDTLANGIEFLPDGNIVAFYSEYIRVITPAGKVIAELKPDGSIRNATASRDGKLIAAVFANCSTVVYDSSLHNQLASFQGFFPAGAVALSATGDKVASGGYDGSTTVWQVAAPHEQLFRFDGCDEGVLQTIFSPDDALLASAALGKVLLVWDMVTGDLRYTIPERVICFRFIGNRTLFLLGLDCVSVFDLTQANPCVARLSSPSPEPFVGGDIHGNRIVVYDRAGKDYELLLVNFKC